MVWQGLVGLLLGTALALPGTRHRLLSRSGGAALVVGTVAVWALGGWAWGSSLSLMALACGWIAAWRRAEKAGLPSSMAARPLDAGAVLARIAWPILLGWLGHMSHQDYTAAYAGSLAAAVADIWATEVGLLSFTPPRSLLSGRPTRHGMPGAVSSFGTVAGAGAAGLTGLVCLVATWLHALLGESLLPKSLLWLPLATLLAGSLAAITDSLLGGAAQALYRCDDCEAFTDRPVHDCGGQARHLHGWAWMTNEMVDLVASLIGAGIGITIVRLLGAL